MTEEEIRKIINDTFSENIMNNLDSSIIFKYIEGLEKENQELKKQLEEKENQQEEFIEYLVNEIKEHENHDKKNNCEWQGYNFYQDVLSKHKEIIGDKDE